MVILHIYRNSKNKIAKHPTYTYNFCSFFLQHSLKHFLYQHSNAKLAQDQQGKLPNLLKNVTNYPNDAITYTVISDGNSLYYQKHVQVIHKLTKNSITSKV